MRWPGAAADRRSSAGLRRSVTKWAPELQFWGYEGGNLLAAIAGAGGFTALYDTVLRILLEPGVTPMAKALRLFAEFPDAAATIGLAVIVLWSIGMGAIARLTALDSLNGWIDGIAAVAGITLIATTIMLGVNWITLSAVFFVSASALLRLCRTYPLFLKFGGLLLTAGGICLTAPGTLALYTGSDPLLGFFTAATGACVAAAGLMTYRGGIFECRAARTRFKETENHGLLDPAGSLARRVESILDRPIESTIRSVVLPSLFWIDAGTKHNAPFMTSMWARLPWRVLTAIAALASGTSFGVTFAAANLCWAVGDISIGSLDWDRDPVEKTVPAGCRHRSEANDSVPSVRLPAKFRGRL